jgi:hypothetical protein
VAAPGCDMWHADSIVRRYSWANFEVTHVTTERVTRVTVTSVADVAG